MSGEKAICQRVSDAAITGEKLAKIVPRAVVRYISYYHMAVREGNT